MASTRDLASSRAGGAGTGPEPSSIDRRFAAQAAARPAATAVELGEQRLTYAELEGRANRLANFLIGRGLGPEALVGVLLPRSLDLVVAILGALKAGAAYVPLDPAYPADRLAYIWQDACAGRTPGAGALLLGSAELGGWLPAGAELLDPARLAEPIAAQSPVAPPAAALPDNLAYVIYTSGSTGRPKGVAVPHRGLLNTIRVAVEKFGTGPGSRVLQLASISFDASVLEMWLALAAGGTLVLTPRETLLSGEALGGELARRRITAMAIPPSLLERVEGSDFPHLRAVVVGAEACSAATARRWSAGRALWNAYAPTEATIFATLFACAAAQDEAPPLRPGDRRHALPAAACRPDAGRGGRDGGDLPRRRRRGARLSRPSRPDRRALPARSLRRDAGRAPLSHRRPGALPVLAATSSSSAAPTIRSRCAASASSSARSRRCSAGHPAVRSAVVVAREDAPPRRRRAGAMAAGEQRLVAYLVTRGGAAAGARDAARLSGARSYPTT